MKLGELFESLSVRFDGVKISMTTGTVKVANATGDAIAPQNCDEAESAAALVTPTQFLSALFAGFDEQSVHLTSIKGDPSTASSSAWFGGRLGAKYALHDEENLFYSVGVLAPSSISRSVANVDHHVAIVFDDVGDGPGAKVPSASLDALEAAGFAPLAKVETSPNNWQWVFRLKDAVPEDGGEACRVIAYLRDFLKSNGWGDPACFDAARYMRLPGGINGKPQYVNPLDGSPWRVWATHFDAAASVDLYSLTQHLTGPDFLAKAMLGPVGPARALAGNGGTPNRNASMDDPLVKLAAAVGLNPRPSSRLGVIDCDCPNHAIHGVHSSGNADGFAFIGSDGTAKCFHGHCEDLRSDDFRKLMEDMYDANEALHVSLDLALPPTETGRGFLAREAFRNEPIEPEQLAIVAPAKSLALAPVQPFAPTQIPPREWLYGRAIIRRYISMVVAPGGTGKSALTMVEAVAMATGKTLLPGDNPVSPLRVWLHNAEDDRLELQRRLAAALQHHKLTLADLNNNLILSSGRDVPLCLARDGAHGPKIEQRSVDHIIEQSRRLAVDVIMLDPLGALHTLPENSNEAMNLLMGALREIADKARVAIVLVHHTSKVASTNMSAAGAGASRGASALVDAVRSSRQLGQMTEKEAGDFGVPLDQRWAFIRVDNGKANLAPAEAARWVRLVGVSLNNGNVQYPQGDTVQTVEDWTPPPQTLGSTADLINVQRAVSQAAAPPRWSDKSPDWVGYLVAEATGLDIGEPASGQKGRDANQNAARRKVVAMLNAWKRQAALTTIQQHDGRTGRTMEIVEVGKAPAEPTQTDPQVVPVW